MILWLSVAGAVMLTTVAVVRVLQRGRRRRRDPDWGDWPPDQMAQ